MLVASTLAVEPQQFAGTPFCDLKLSGNGGGEIGILRYLMLAMHKGTSTLKNIFLQFFFFLSYMFTHYNSES